jgi:hypothetical protein
MAFADPAEAPSSEVLADATPSAGSRLSARRRRPAVLREESFQLVE